MVTSGNWSRNLVNTLQMGQLGSSKRATLRLPLPCTSLIACLSGRVFTKFVDQLDDVTVYRFMFPVIDPSSQALARTAWCSPDRAGTWKAIMAGRRPTGNQDCDVSGLVEILKFGEKHRIQNTPTVFLGNGKRLVGATPPEQFVAELDASGKAQ